MIGNNRSHEWRRTLAGKIGPDDAILDELEGHLREEMNRRIQEGQPAGDPRTGNEIRTLKGHNLVTTWLIQFAPDGKTILAGGSDAKIFNVVVFFDVASGKEVQVIRGPEMVYFDSTNLSISRDGKILVTGGNQIRFWDTGTGTEIQGVIEQGSIPTFSPNGKMMANFGKNEILLHEVATGKIRAHIKLPPGQTTFAFAPDHKNMVLNGDGSTIRLVDLVTGKDLWTPHGHAGPILKVTAAAGVLASLSTDQTIRLWELASGKELRHWRLSPNSWMEGIALSPDAKMLAVLDGGLRILDVSGGKEIKQLSDFARIKNMTFSPDGKKLATDQGDIWDLATGQVLRLSERHLDLLAFSPDGKVLTGMNFGKGLFQWKTATGKVLF